MDNGVFPPTNHTHSVTDRWSAVTLDLHWRLTESVYSIIPQENVRRGRTEIEGHACRVATQAVVCGTHLVADLRADEVHVRVHTPRRHDEPFSGDDLRVDADRHAKGDPLSNIHLFLRYATLRFLLVEE